MATEMHRFMLSIPKEMESEVQSVKKNYFYDKSYAEMYRQLIQIGLERMSAVDEEEVETTTA